VNLVPRAGRPPPLYIAQCDGVHQPCRVGRPRSGRENRAQKAVGPNGGRSKPNILNIHGGVNRSPTFRYGESCRVFLVSDSKDLCWSQSKTETLHCRCTSITGSRKTSGNLAKLSSTMTELVVIMRLATQWVWAKPISAKPVKNISMFFVMCINIWHP
jgi:hypothetical protein